MHDPIHGSDEHGSFTICTMVEICCDSTGAPEMFGLMMPGDEGTAAILIANHVEDHGSECNITFRPSEWLKDVKTYHNITEEN